MARWLSGANDGQGKDENWNVTALNLKVSLLDPPNWKNSLKKVQSIYVMAGKASWVQKKRMTIICIYLIQKLYFQRGGNMGPGEILLSDREFQGHKAEETISIIFHLILYTFPNSLWCWSLESSPEPLALKQISCSCLPLPLPLPPSHLLLLQPQLPPAPHFWPLPNCMPVGQLSDVLGVPEPLPGVGSCS